MARRPVFYSFHYGNDVFRVQQVRNMGVMDGNEPTSPNNWESIKRRGDQAVKNWIDENMKYKQCVIVLVGTQTSERDWVNYEIKKAWEDGKPIFGIYIHNLNCPRNGTSRKGLNPFDGFTFPDGSKLSSVVKCYEPNALYAYSDIQANINSWIDAAIRQRQ
jgi:hypothetical protein